MESIRNILPVKVKWPMWLLMVAAKMHFQKVMGTNLEYKHLQSFNEKMQLYRIKYDLPSKIGATDKIKFKSFIYEKLGSKDYTVPIYGHWDSAEGLIDSWDSLPDRFVLKSNLSYGGQNIIFVKEKSVMDKFLVASEVKEWLNPRNTMMNTLSCRMYNSTPAVLAEQYLDGVSGNLNDYKFFCFNGFVHSIYVAVGHFEEGGSRISFFDKEWNNLHILYGHHLPVDVERPENLDKMIETASILSKGFPFVRVDFFDLGEKFYLSELTFDSGAGTKAFTPSSFDIELGSFFDISSLQ